MLVEVARRYTFSGVHHMPGLPAPWCERHDHDYTVEVVARRTVQRGYMVVDTDKVDEVWGEVGLVSGVFHDMDKIYGPDMTSVEALSSMWLSMFKERVPEVYRVVVWEDTTRWGSAELVSEQ